MKSEDEKTVTGNIVAIGNEIIDGRNIYYIKIDSLDKIFTFNSSLDVNIVFASVGTTIEIKYTDANSNVIPAKSINVQ